MTICLDDLCQAAADLRSQGINAEHDFIYGPHGCLEGLNVDDEFFPHWELCLPENAEALARVDFAAIKQRRCADWRVEPPIALRAVGE